MKQTFTLAAFLFLFVQSAFCQQPFGHLTIFSEEGDRFFLILNGERINETAQTNLRVEELTQPYYNAKIIFEDNTRSEITKNYLQIADVDNVFSDVTYKIKRDKKNPAKMKLNFFSMTPVVPDYIPPSNVYVTHWGSPHPTGSVTQTTTTTTSSGGINAGMNIGGVGVNVTVHDGGFGSTTTQTTTVSTSSTGLPEPGYIEDNGCANRHGMTNQNFTAALATIQKQSFDETKLKTANQITDSNCMSASQIAQICQTFGFEETKLEFAKHAYAACVEPNNYFKVNNVFTFSSSVDELTKYISGK